MRQNISIDDLRQAVTFAEYTMPTSVSRYSLHSCVQWINVLTKIDERYSAYFSGVALLHVARKILRNGFCHMLMDIIETILRLNFSQCCSILSLCKTELTI